jgi:Arc/MetJ-type ribon-helix-helix transcriptional regulator
MTITLTQEQERAIQAAIAAGLVGSVDEFIVTAIQALPVQCAGFDKEGAEVAVARIRELRKGVELDLQGMSLRDFAHIGHRY